MSGLQNFLSRIASSILQTCKPIDYPQQSTAAAPIYLESHVRSSAIHTRAHEGHGNTQQEAKEVEKAIHERASSVKEYTELCVQAALIVQESSSTRTRSLEPSPACDDTLLPSAVTIGKYAHAVHHRNGIFSEVYKAPTSSQLLVNNMELDTVALKVTTPPAMVAPHDSEKEARILQGLHPHDHIITLIETFRGPGGQFVLVLPYMPYGLDSLLEAQSLTDDQAKGHLYGMFAGLAHIHEHGIIHRDVKPSNVLLRSADGPAFLSDFGISWSAGDEASEDSAQKITDVGTTSYRPLEILFGKKDYDQSLDMWAAGCVVAEVASLSSRPLFESGSVGTELALIQSIFMTLGTPNEQTWPSASQCPDWGKMQWKDFAPRSWSDVLPKASMNAQNLVSLLTQYEPVWRLSAKKALKHTYFQ